MVLMSEVISIPSATTCVSCQNFLEQPAKLTAEIARIRHELNLMEQQFAASENLELVSRETLEIWQELIHCHRERLATLQAALESRL